MLAFVPVERQPISVSQLAELIGVEPWRLIDIEVNLLKSTARIVLEPADMDPKDLHPPVVLR